MFIVFFALWVVLNGKWTTEIGVFGLAFAAIMYLFTWKYMNYGPKVDAALVRRVPHAIRYGVTLVREIVAANLNVVRIIFTGSEEIKPQLVQFDVDLRKNRHLVALANSITLTPGTITVDLQDHHFTVHALDASMVEGLDDGVFVQQLIRLEEKHGARPAAQPQAEAPAEAPAAEAEQAMTAEPAQEMAAEAEQKEEEQHEH